MSEKENIEQAITHLRMAIQHLEDAKQAEHDKPVLRLVKKVTRQLTAK